MGQRLHARLEPAGGRVERATPLLAIQPPCKPPAATGPNGHSRAPALKQLNTKESLDVGLFGFASIDTNECVTLEGPNDAQSAGDSNARFAQTRWSVVITARDCESPQAQAALARLCEIYWYPIYAFLRRKGHSTHEAEDLTQGFFAHVLQREWLRNVGPEKGRFRTFVLR